MSAYSLEWKPRAIKDAEQLDERTRERVIAALERLAETSIGDVVRLKGTSPPEYRLRVGKWRARFQRDDQRKVLTVLRVLPRGKAYR
ncbi:MAG: type II toxin-antitoxin system RelE family toxin [Vicinamibacteria bacterium]